MSEEFGKLVRDRRLALGYSLGQLANRVGRTASLIRGWERGVGRPDATEVAILAVGLDLDEAVLVAKLHAADPLSDVGPQDDQTPVVGPLVDESDHRAPLPASTVDRTSGIHVKEPAVEGSASRASYGDAAIQLTSGPDESGDEGSAASSAAAKPPRTTDSMVIGEVVLSRETDIASLIDAPTESVPLVSATATATPGRPVAPTEPTGSSPALPQSSVAKEWSRAVEVYHRILDPNRPWIYRMRWIMLIGAFYVMARVVQFSASGLFEAIGEVLDLISFGTPEVSSPSTS